LLLAPVVMLHRAYRAFMKLCHSIHVVFAEIYLNPIRPCLVKYGTLT